MEVCPTTNKECAILTAVKERKLQNLIAKKTDGTPANERLANRIFDEEHQKVIDIAQERYCSVDVCGLITVSVALTVNLAALEQVRKEFNS